MGQTASSSGSGGGRQPSARTAAAAASAAARTGAAAAAEGARKPPPGGGALLEGRPGMNTGGAGGSSTSLVAASAESGEALKRGRGRGGEGAGRRAAARRGLRLPTGRSALRRRAVQCDQRRSLWRRQQLKAPRAPLARPPGSSTGRISGAGSSAPRGGSSGDAGGLSSSGPPSSSAPSSGPPSAGAAAPRPRASGAAPQGLPPAGAPPLPPVARHSASETHSGSSNAVQEARGAASLDSARSARSTRSSFVLETVGGRASADAATVTPPAPEVDAYGRPSFAAFEPPRESLLSRTGVVLPAASAAAPAGPSAASVSRGSVFESALPTDLAWRYRALGALLPQAPLPLATLQQVWQYGDPSDAAEAAHIFEMQVGCLGRWGPWRRGCCVLPDASGAAAAG
jgi:hypothetical protein